MADTITPIVMPKFGLAMTEGKLAFWSVDDGDTLKVGDEIADIETSKITNAYESPVDGVLRRKVAAAGDTLRVGALIGVVAPADVSDADIDSFIETFQSTAVVEDDEGAVATVTEPTQIDIGGQSIRVLDLHGPDGVPVLLIHGFGGDLNGWLFTQPPLAVERRAISFDLPGHGGSDKTVEDGSKEALAKVALGVLDALGVDKAHLVGHSLGGGVAIAAAAAAPERVASLSLIAPAGLGSEINGDFITTMAEATRTRDIEAGLRPLFADPGLVSRDMVQDMQRFKRIDGVTAALRAIAAANFPDGHQADLTRSRLEELSAPVQIIWGEADAVVPVAQSADLPDRIAVHVLAGAGHMPQMEQTAAVNKLLIAFLAAH
ncbi:branched-chain alpha-keto acid dehydrogenase subunit E2 [Ameyamaea chiangmaiensis NBRC 103196]|uniref:Acetoin dehydrogenase dihydrolipoyllysine-residue acetyltransferase subunit n=1 Tax=Ameyamaea chiangmaiensis TaxID=442969 RepID=A0A850PDP7_9PROT|nr:acetoin dehydrogenase dihydrolipoyllysine-residue acetyltransferase subunit [Ameyamaea chiangmaiensis]MBS4074218.1 acetoin dehydrogenase dihydrolipoyllysine-residue acetyltransferase subunit [Ameyamaea chiangmaiensis]NVN39161.1 acetoin dehydrogenase dihydrolipoyllysine-residue acetyltransferase subunit [Ameyamaea chiangmaiensis]GBQ71279.1 branched-chain alpha-keto acid dehydrogenase subunit E2 [Ameyamaea chiangmaiensis NBRC 103196]